MSSDEDNRNLNEFEIYRTAAFDPSLSHLDTTSAEDEQGSHGHADAEQEGQAERELPPRAPPGLETHRQQDPVPHDRHRGADHRATTTKEHRDRGGGGDERWLPDPVQRLRDEPQQGSTGQRSGGGIRGIVEQHGGGLTDSKNDATTLTEPNTIESDTIYPEDGAHPKPADLGDGGPGTEMHSRHRLPMPETGLSPRSSILEMPHGTGEAMRHVRVDEGATLVGGREEPKQGLPKSVVSTGSFKLVEPSVPSYPRLEEGLERICGEGGLQGRDKKTDSENEKTPMAEEDYQQFKQWCEARYDSHRKAMAAKK